VHAADCERFRGLYFAAQREAAELSAKVQLLKRVQDVRWGDLKDMATAVKVRGRGTRL
jgi:hypothetical protein